MYAIFFYDHMTELKDFVGVRKTLESAQIRCMTVAQETVDKYNRDYGDEGYGRSVSIGNPAVVMSGLNGKGNIVGQFTCEPITDHD